jgi:hypothetical protein
MRVSGLLDLPAQPPSGQEHIANIDVAIGPGGCTGLRAEYLELGDPVSAAQVGQAFIVDLNAGCRG